MTSAGDDRRRFIEEIDTGLQDVAAGRTMSTQELKRWFKRKRGLNLCWVPFRAQKSSAQGASPSPREGASCSDSSLAATAGGRARGRALPEERPKRHFTPRGRNRAWSIETTTLAPPFRRGSRYRVENARVPKGRRRPEHVPLQLTRLTPALWSLVRPDSVRRPEKASNS